jgi:hypothetical protein
MIVDQTTMGRACCGVNGATGFAAATAQPAGCLSHHDARGAGDIHWSCRWVSIGGRWASIDQRLHRPGIGTTGKFVDFRNE